MIYPYDTCIDKDNQDMDTEVQFDLSCPLRGHTPKSTYTHMHTFAVKINNHLWSQFIQPWIIPGKSNWLVQ